MRMEELQNESEELKDLIRDMPQEIMQRCRVKHIAPQVEIMRKFEKMTYVYILCEGECDVLRSFKDGQLYVLGKIKGLKLIGEQEVLAEINELSATVKTVTKCRFLLIHQEDFWDWIRCDSHAAIFLLKYMAKRLNEATREAGIPFYYPSIYLLKKYLVEAYEEAKSETLRVQVKRQQIADELGISLRSVERCVRELKDERLIRIVKGKMEINRDEYDEIVDTLEE
ncbi:Crp/Fnr family transcriptional regulator [Gottschalkiaceae bacterium SANA]|nr:Crp/Fnr family transcriptional regulator [Gottschalkiaceae bacterium SANA]